MLHQHFEDAAYAAVTGMTLLVISEGQYPACVLVVGGVVAVAGVEGVWGFHGSILLFGFTLWFYFVIDAEWMCCDSHES